MSLDIRHVVGGGRRRAVEVQVVDILVMDGEARGVVVQCREVTGSWAAPVTLAIGDSIELEVRR